MAEGYRQNFASNLAHCLPSLRIADAARLLAALRQRADRDAELDGRRRASCSASRVAVAASLITPRLFCSAFMTLEWRFTSFFG